MNNMTLEEAKEELFNIRFDIEHLEDRFERMSPRDPEYRNSYNEIRSLTIRADKLKKFILEEEAIREV